MIYKIEYNSLWQGRKCGSRMSYPKPYRVFIHAMDASDALRQEAAIAALHNMSKMAVWRMTPSSVREELEDFLAGLPIDVTICRTEDDCYGELQFDGDDLDRIVEIVRGED